MSKSLNESNVYLESIEINNFRPFRASRALELPRGPGVTLLVGPNGLGKTSVFEAIEWALTDDVQRLKHCEETPKRRRERSYLQRCLPHKQSPRSDCWVELSFSSQESIRRQLSTTYDKRELAKNILDLLAHPEHQSSLSLDGLQKVLFMTHLLPQSSSVRPLTAESRSIWERFEPVAGLEANSLVVDAVDSASRARNKILNAEQTRQNDCQAALAGWRALVQRRQTAQRSASARAQALDPSQCKASLKRIAKALDGIIRLPTEDSLSAENDWLTEALQEAQQQLDGEIGRAAAREPHLRKLEGTLKKWMEIGVDAAAVSGTKKELEKQRDVLREKLKGEEALRDDHRSTLSKLITSLADCHSALKEIQSLPEAKKRLGTLSEAAKVSAQDLEAAKIELEKVALSLTTAREKVTKRATLAQQLRSLQSRATIIRSAGEVVKRIDEGQKQLAELETKLSLASENEVKGQDELAARIATHRGIEERAKDARNLASALAQKTSAIKKAVADIAARLSKDDVACPVCGQPYGPGKLLERAEAAAAAMDPDLAEAEGIAVKAEKAREESKRGVLEHKRSLTLLRAAVEKLEAAALQKKNELNASRQSTELTQIDVEPDAASIQLKLKQVGTELLVLEGQLRNFPPKLEVEESLTLAEEKHRKTALAVDEKQQHLQKAESERDIVSKVIAELQEKHGLISTNEQQIEKRLGTLKEREEALNRSISDANEALTRLKNTSTELESSIVALSGKLTQAAVQAEACANQLLEAEKEWTERGIELPPSEERLGDERRKLRAHSERIQLSLRRLARLRRGFSAWLDSDVLRGVEAEISTVLEGRSEDEYETTLEANLNRAAVALRKAERAGNALDRLQKDLQQRQDGFSQNVLQPLQKPFRNFLKALVVSKDDSDLALVNPRRQNKDQLSATYHESNETLGGLPASFFLSEGQLAEVSVAFLLAMSTKFRWSRWPALLLDDPLQYNDLIHATSFFEVIRNLVKFNGYQVLLSSHNTEQAAFFGRKLDGAGVPVYQYRLFADGRGGTQWRRE